MTSSGGIGAKPFTFTHTPGAVNTLQMIDSLTGQPVWIGAIGSDANINLEVFAKGTGRVVIPSPVSMSAIPTADPHIVSALWANAGILTVSAG